MEFDFVTHSGSFGSETQRKSSSWVGRWMGGLVKSDFVTPSETFRAQLAFRIQASLNLPDSNPCLESKTEQSVAKAQNYIEGGGTPHR